MTSNVQHTDVGAYALGLLEESDRHAFEAHLATCPACQAELREFGEMAQLLGEVRQNPPQAQHPEQSEVSGKHVGPGPTGSGVAADPRSAPVVDLLRRKATADRSRRRGRVALAIAAGVVLVAGGGAIGVVLGGDEPAGQHDVAGPTGPAEQLLMTGARTSATDPKTKAAGVIAVETKPWGTHVALQLENVRGPLECELVAVSTSGAKRVVTGWAVPPKGWGVPGSPKPGMLHGGTSFKRDQIARFDVMILGGERDGERLLSIPA
ncbi:anti-sigma factor family protein [Flindersiella endophytica]